MNAKIDGYMAGVRDARTGRTPEHSQTHYVFPRHATLQEQADYNEEYANARRDMAEARELNARWIETHCIECYEVLPKHHSGCPTLIELIETN